MSKLNELCLALKATTNEQDKAYLKEQIREELKKDEYKEGVEALRSVFFRTLHQLIAQSIIGKPEDTTSKDLNEHGVS